MSVFSLGGNIGFALGPTIATPLVLWFGLRGGLLLALPSLVIAGMLLAAIPFLLTFAPERGSHRAASGEDRPGALATLSAVIGFRSFAWFGLITFVPLWEVSLGHSKAYGNHLLSLMLLAGVLGTVVVGPAADRIGRRPVQVVSLAVMAPCMFVFVAVGGVIGMVALCFVGMSVIGTFGVTMVMSQEYLPRQIGMASGLSIGLSIGLGGVAARRARRARGLDRPADGALRVRGGAARGTGACAAAPSDRFARATRARDRGAVVASRHG